VVLATTAAALSLTACSGTTGSPTARHVYAVGVRTETFLDVSRATPANGDLPAHVGRTLETTIFYPAVGAPGIVPTRAAPPDRAHGPYPLIVFAHGYGSAPDDYAPVLERWAAAGYVVAAPRFPLTRSDAPGGPDLADFANQPADMSFVIAEMLYGSRSPGPGPWAGVVDRRHIGAAGHSLGGVTTLGLVADTCCRDRRVDAAVVMSGDPITFPTGRVDFGSAPPLLLVHGNADPAVPYVSSITAYNAAHPPKGLLTVLGGDHGAPVNPGGRGFAGVIAATTDFFDAYLGHRPGSLRSLQSAAVRGATTLTWVATNGTVSTLPVPTVPRGNRLATVTPSTGLSEGQTVTVRWSGFAPGQSVNVLECAKSPPRAAGDCDLQTGLLLQPDPTGTGTLTIVLHTGAIGSGGGLCDAAHLGCVIAVNEGGSLDLAATVTVGISFR
jgi:dienelactone hydrolase